MKRTYHQNCALAHALDVVGERWTLLLVRELLLGPRRYGELLENLSGIGTNLLSERLKDMEAAGLVHKRDRRYELTALGRGLEPAVHALVRFGLSLRVEDDPDRLSRPEWDAVALQALYRSECDEGLPDTCVLELDGSPFRLEQSGSGVQVVPGDSDRPAVRLSLSKRAARNLANGIMSPASAFQRGDITVQGSRKRAMAVLRAFSLAPRA